MRLDLDEYRRQIIERAGGKVSDFYDAETDEWKIGKAQNDKTLVINAFDLCCIEDDIRNAYKAGLLDAIDEKEMACESAYKTGFLEGINCTTKAMRGETDE